jgi:hypothetical protein
MSQAFAVPILTLSPSVISAFKRFLPTIAWWCVKLGRSILPHSPVRFVCDQHSNMGAGSGVRTRRMPGKAGVNAVAKVDSWRDPRERPCSGQDRVLQYRGEDDLPSVLHRFSGPDQELAAALERWVHMRSVFLINCYPGINFFNAKA